ncbi:MAG: enoyl-CoA hydratase/isomerase family protein [Candidatus Helarchaeota archaeon]
MFESKETRVLFERKGKVGVVTLNRPEVLNCLNLETLQDLREILEHIRDDRRIRVVLISGKGRAFSTGMDLKSTKGKTVEQLRKINHYGLVETFSYLQNFAKPTIAMINGYALGGGLELALSCDFRFASKEHAKLGFPEIKLGILPTWGGMYLPIRLINSSRTLELVLTGNQIDADMAYQIGLVNRVVPHEELFSAALAFAKDLARKGSFLLQLGKYVIRNSIIASNEDRIRLTTLAMELITAGSDGEDRLNKLLKEQVA